MIQSPEISGMRCFVLLAEELHFGRAAKRLNMTQPTLSQQIKKLENACGVQMFVRSTRSVDLTPSGHTFLPLARAALSKLDEAVLLAKLAAGGMSPGGELLKIGAINPAVYGLLPLILRRFRSRFPETRLDIKVFDSSDMLLALERGEYDVGIMRPSTSANAMRFRPLTSDRFLAVIPKKLPLATRATVRLADFVGQDVFTLRRFELSSFKAVHDQVVEAGIDVDLDVRASDTRAALAMASAGVGITFLPEWIRSVADSEVVLRKVEDLTQELPIGIAWRPDSPVPGILPFVEYAELVTRTT